MGQNAQTETADRVLEALDAALADERAPALAGLDPLARGTHRPTPKRSTRPGIESGCISSP